MRGVHTHPTHTIFREFHLRRLCLSSYNKPISKSKEQKMGKTLDDLKAAFAGESQANRKYLAFAKAADAEGFPQVARLFRAAAAAETVHAHNHLKAMLGVKSTKENVQAAIEGEHYEVVTMYPEFIADAKAEMTGAEKSEITPKGLKSFNWAYEVEKGHEALYRQALETLGQAQEEYDFYVCPVCGLTHAKNAPDKCPICGTSGEKFEKIH
jgi:rubrerythrin